MKRFLKFSRGERGFTLIELLIVVAILGILAAVVIPNAFGILGTATLNAANTEASNVKTAAIAYAADNNGVWPASSDDLTIAGGDVGTVDYLSGTLKATYTFDTTTGLISEADPGTKGADGWGTDIHWDEPTQLWEKGPAQL